MGTINQLIYKKYSVFTIERFRCLDYYREVETKSKLVTANKGKKKPILIPNG